MRVRKDLPYPEIDFVRAKIDTFDNENRSIENGLTQLIRCFPKNNDLGQVRVKVVAINSLYSTNIWDTYSVAKVIVESELDSKLETGSTEAVRAISKVERLGKARWNYSFATKYCSWHRQDLYPIFDSRVDFCLRSYQSKDQFARFTQAELWDYEAFRNTVIAFRRHYHLESLTFKELDKFLYQLGSEHFSITEPIAASNVDRKEAVRIIPDTKSRYQGCLLGGAVGDALGAPVEFMSFSGIVKQFGANGIQDFATAYDRIGAITDDTQMVLFTAEGLVRAQVRGYLKGICDPPSIVHGAYLRWLRTQGERPARLDHEIEMDGWLVSVKGLWNRRAPGNTCLSALREARQLGDRAENNSKGCGTVMRIAPVGLLRQDGVFELASRIAALTHGHPSGILAAGFLAELLKEINLGRSLNDALQKAKTSLIEQSDNEEVLAAVERAEVAASSGDSSAVSAGKLGEGWVAEEALSIALFSALLERNFERAVITAVNHSGDSDSTGAIAGNICGLLYGVESIPERWLSQLEMREEIGQIADDLQAIVEGGLDMESNETWRRYPGY